MRSVEERLSQIEGRLDEIGELKRMLENLKCEVTADVNEVDMGDGIKIGIDSDGDLYLQYEEELFEELAALPNDTDRIRALQSFLGRYIERIEAGEWD